MLINRLESASDAKVRAKAEEKKKHELEIADIQETRDMLADLGIPVMSDEEWRKHDKDIS
jgi:hypothetical protein